MGKRVVFSRDYVTPALVNPILAGMCAEILSQRDNKVELLAENGIRLWVPLSVIENIPDHPPVQMGDCSPVCGDLGNADPLPFSKEQKEARIARIMDDACDYSTFVRGIENAEMQLRAAEAAIAKAKENLRLARAAEMHIRSAARKLCGVKVLGDAAIAAQLRENFPKYAKKSR